MKKITLLLVVSLLLFINLKLLAQNWVNGGNTLSAIGRFGTNNNFSIIFESNNIERGRLTNTGLWGFGTSAPSTKVHINSSTGQNPFRVQVNGSSKLFVHNGGGVSVGSPSTPPANGLFVSGNAGIGTTTPEQKLHVVGNEILSTGIGAGFKFRNRNSTTSADDWVWYSEGNIARFWRAGVGDLIGITTGGNVGIGTIAPGSHKVKIVHGTFGFMLENATTQDDWELWINSGGLSLYANGAFRGNFNPSTGAYSSVSDERLKTNIKMMPSILDKVNQLKPTTYEFKAANTTTEGSTPESYGFLAQEVMKIFPHLVTHNVDKERGLDSYTLDYSGFGVLAIKGIQELQQTIQAQNQTINTLEERIAKLETALNAISNSNSSNNGTSGALLEQNQPNPFNQSTTIRYTIPAGANAYIMIYDISGKLVKTMPASGNGQSQINANELEAGTYIYNLMVNGQLAASKKMLLSK